MEEKTTEELKRLMAEVAQELTRRMEQEKRYYHIPFPRGHIRTLGHFAQRWPYLPANKRRTLACMLQLCDINRWHLNVWEIGLTAGTVWEWHCTLPVIAVIESLIHGFGVEHGIFDENTGFKKSINKLHNAGVINNALRDELHALRQMRDEIHLFLKGDVQMHDKTAKRYNRSVKALQWLEGCLMFYEVPEEANKSVERTA